MASWWRTRAVVLGAALLALVAVVALATRAEAPAGGGGTRQVNAQLVAQYGVLAVFLLAAAALPFLIWSLRGARDDEPALPRRGNWMRRLLVTVIALSLISTAVLVYRSHQSNGKAKTATSSLTAPVKKQPAAGKRPPARFDWVPLIAVLAVGVGGAGLAIVLLRRARPTSTPRRPAAAAGVLSDALDESLDDLRAEQDARRAVIAAYARMERACAAAGVPRRASEAPLEYLARVLTELLHASAASVSRLTTLFERAQFSLHAMGPELKTEAIEALVAVRDELRAEPA